jgi:hypothetical protein
MQTELVPGGTILIVEDDDNDLALIPRALRKAHVSNDTIVARDGVPIGFALFQDMGGQHGLHWTLINRLPRTE